MDALDAAIRQRQQQLALQDEKRALQRLMEDFFKKVDRRAAESADEVMGRYTKASAETLERAEEPSGET